MGKEREKICYEGIRGMVKEGEKYGMRGEDAWVRKGKSME
jgi:hypothetical protein